MDLMDFRRLILPPEWRLDDDEVRRIATEFE